VQVRDGKKFLKGLAVIDDVAYFGVSVWSERSARGDPSQDSELAAFCLRGMELLWRREVSLTLSPRAAALGERGVGSGATSTIQCDAAPLPNRCPFLPLRTLHVDRCICSCRAHKESWTRSMELPGWCLHVPASYCGWLPLSQLPRWRLLSSTSVPQVPTHGLLNVVAAPQLAVSSTYRALDPGLQRPTRQKVRSWTSCMVFALSLPQVATLGHAPYPLYRGAQKHQLPAANTMVVEWNVATFCTAPDNAP